MNWLSNHLKLTAVCLIQNGITFDCLLYLYTYADSPLKIDQELMLHSLNDVGSEKFNCSDRMHSHEMLTHHIKMKRIIHFISSCEKLISCLQCSLTDECYNPFNFGCNQGMDAAAVTISNPNVCLNITRISLL